MRAAAIISITLLACITARAQVVHTNDFDISDLIDPAIISNTAAFNVARQAKLTNTANVLCGDISGTTGLVKRVSGNAAGVTAIDADNRRFSQHSFTVTNDAIFTMTNLTSDGFLWLTVKQDTNGGHAVVFSNTSFMWQGGSEPALASNASAINVLTFIGASSGKACELSVTTNLTSAP